jgi:hypothetical protein
MMVSTVVHTVIFLALALCLGNAIPPEKPKNDGPSFVSEGGDAEVEEIEKFTLAEPTPLNTEVDLNPQEMKDLGEIPPDLEMTAGIPDGDANSLGTGSAAGPESNLGGLGLNITASGLGPNAMGGLGGFDGKGGMGGTGKGTGLPGKGATFFGVKSLGTKICFVVDNSGSMKGPKWNTAVTELIAAVDKLNGRQAFYILFFSDKPLPMFSPNQPQNMIFATPQVKEKLAQWLYNVELKKGTNGSETMKMALALKPDIIYVLGDGEFTDKVVPELLAMEGVKTKINTIGFNMREGSRGDRDFSSIAKKFRGTYRVVKSQ